MSQAVREIRKSVVATGPSRRAALFGQQGPCTQHTIEVWNSIDEIDRAAWDSLRGSPDLFMDVRLLRVVETSMARDASFRYVLFRDGSGRPAASACLCVYAVDGTLLADEGIARRAACALKRISTKLVTYKILFCGMPFSGGQSHLRFAPGADHATIIELLDGLMRSLAREAGAKCIVFKEFEQHELAALETVERLGYQRADSLPMNQLRLEHATYDAYLAGLHNRKRYEIRKSLKKLADGGVRLHTTSDVAEIERLYSPEVHQMYEAVVGKATTKLERLPREFFLEMARQLPENSEFCFLMKDEQVLGFGLCLFAGGWYHPLFMGVAYDRNRDFDLYFNIMYRAVADALRHGTRELTLGQDSDEFKRSKLGSFQTPRYFHIKGVGFVMETAIRLLSKQLFPPRPLLVSLPEQKPEPAPARQSA